MPGPRGENTAIGKAAEKAGIGVSSVLIVSIPRVIRIRILEVNYTIIIIIIIIIIIKLIHFENTYKFYSTS